MIDPKKAALEICKWGYVTVATTRPPAAAPAPKADRRRLLESIPAAVNRKLAARGGE